MSTGHLYHGSSEIDRKWVDALIRKLESQTHFDHAHEIPYCGGSSDDWTPGHRCVYADKDTPLTYKQKDGKKVDVKRYITIHEAVERTLMQAPEQGGLGLDYTEAHAVATAAELAAVKSDGYSEDEYTAFWDKWEKAETDEGDWYGVPDDLYMRPYQDSKDRKTMSHMHVSVLGRIKARAKYKSEA